ncbi:PTS system IIA component, L-Asc family [Clostridium pasteurianum DSM 525 = ATCC 6013]|uniref:Ascorbate-specific PTS system EIIA component n=1 Tax=Clostridium pasteurianum DSM 525 = ATCC 6013 TaxID=1262449 RepID=A0A0H3J2B5_CLOPA|nr:PTS sugar transporter subunit IIA [Clostridium pasteurianum]AJA46917.1 PTS system IIA component, L-Asc family [Clostridium pasteurianum DSM 525 = ATCC 6013]AJA50905.1 PTS system IIA component, L-Asc family [Clostridium pasteurianum DSM 525 = ATCC 6013]AOZ74301.1 PTS sugar transporter subunit IIA [Clostridium pasteurianum DSM 525 = ATCC 6013]AOZ78099.1 PTS sugar transporter subunit IIA [Clostridium pasteurianum]ELP58167.1 phosphotransferase system mannitol/fructose-specific IIA domain [Clost
MLQELIEKKRYSFHEGFEKWEDAVQASCKPLLDGGAIEQAYVDAIIANVKKYGPYIVIAPNICIPHAQENVKGVNETAICFMRTKKPVHFSNDPEQDARLFFVLASTDSNVHIQNLSNMVRLIEDERVVQKLLDAEEKEDLEEIIQFTKEKIV